MVEMDGRTGEVRTETPGPSSPVSSNQVYTAWISGSDQSTFQCGSEVKD